ncbi:XK-related protein 8-like [Chanos chanos]|uniref:XK-related protein n=1 Tax=Chanos chanos TaxID=29144 RepID=A0A6J2WLW1_CHACN|nr:XK-related protein 8-like [Chanos chanos]
MRNTCSHCACFDILLTLAGFILYLSDIVLDIWKIWLFYQEGSYILMGVLIFLFLGSPVLLQIFSWLLYADYKDKPKTSVDIFLNKHSLLVIFHVFQLGIFVRFASVVEISVRRLLGRDPIPEDTARHLKHDLFFVRLVETFSESAPQLMLMLSTTFMREEIGLLTGLKTAESIITITLNVLLYHQAMRKFIHDKSKMGWDSAVVFFLWNLFLITARVASLALFASVLPFFVVVHFLTLWILLVLWAWQQQTDFMDGPGGEWLYRATIGLILYFSWFDVNDEKTKLKSNIYHVLTMLDSGLLIGLWWWMRVYNTSSHSPCPLDLLVPISIIVLLYSSGLALKFVHDTWLRPKKPELVIDHPRAHRGDVEEASSGERQVEAEVDSVQPTPRSMSLTPTTEPLTGVKKRMSVMAANFYS